MLIRYRKILLAISLTLSINAGIFSDDNPLSGKGSLDTPDISILGNGNLNDIIKSITGISGELDKYWNWINMDSLKNQIYGNNEMMQCLVDNINIDDIFGDKAKDMIDGICSSINLDKIISQEDTNKILSCVGIDLSTDNMQKNIESICASGGTGVGQDGKGEVDQSLIVGGAINIPSPENPKGVSYSSYFATLKGSIDAELPSTTNKHQKSISDRKYLSGITGYDLYGKGGGALVSEAKKNPNGSTAKALNDFDKSTLILKEQAFALVGHSDTNKIELPKTKLDAIKEQDDIVKLEGKKYHDLDNLSDGIASELIKKFKDIEADTLEEYYKKEKALFASYIKNSKKIKKLYQDEEELNNALLSQKLFLETTRKNYIFDPSQTRADMILPEQKNNFKYLAQIQNTRIANLKLKKFIKYIKRREKIERAVKLSYVKASLWRGDIAKKEIDKMLSAVDQIIK